MPLETPARVAAAFWEAAREGRETRHAPHSWHGARAHQRVGTPIPEGCCTHEHTMTVRQPEAEEPQVSACSAASQIVRRTAVTMRMPRAAAHEALGQPRLPCPSQGLAWESKKAAVGSRAAPG